MNDIEQMLLAEVRGVRSAVDEIRKDICSVRGDVGHLSTRIAVIESKLPGKSKKFLTMGGITVSSASVGAIILVVAQWLGHPASAVPGSPPPSTPGPNPPTVTAAPPPVPASAVLRLVPEGSGLSP